MTSEHYRRVLVVDDEPDIRNLILTALRMKGLDVDGAKSGSEALQMLRDGEYGVVLLDLFMPEIDGFAVLDVIEREDHQPVVLVVTGADRATVERLDARRIHGVVRKPFDVEELANVVLACADLRGRRGMDTLALAVLSGPLIAFLSGKM